MTDAQEFDTPTLDDFLNQAIDQTDHRHTYVNNVRLRISNNEIVFDMYFLAPPAGDINDPPQALRLQRIVMPLGVAKNLGEILLKSIAHWEQATGIELPIIPKAVDMDKEATDGDT